MKIIYIEKDQNWQDAITNYWFSVEDENYAISDCNGELTLLDYGGIPFEMLSDFGGHPQKVFDALEVEYKKYIMD